jgi:hypothetical protein
LIFYAFARLARLLYLRGQILRPQTFTTTRV